MIKPTSFLSFKVKGVVWDQWVVRMPLQGPVEATEACVFTGLESKGCYSPERPPLLLPLHLLLNGSRWPVGESNVVVSSVVEYRKRTSLLRFLAFSWSNKWVLLQDQPGSTWRHQQMNSYRFLPWLLRNVNTVPSPCKRQLLSLLYFKSHTSGMQMSFVTACER